MTIPEAKAAKAKLEQDIAALLVKFNRETGATVTDLCIFCTLGVTNYIVDVDVRL